jgi:hypothetical protein
MKDPLHNPHISPYCCDSQGKAILSLGRLSIFDLRVNRNALILKALTFSAKPHLCLARLKTLTLALSVDLNLFFKTADTSLQNETNSIIPFNCYVLLLTKFPFSIKFYVIHLVPRLFYLFS